VCNDIVEHYRSKVAPLGLKAQVVAFDRELCVAYHNAITALLDPGEEATVVMTTAKGDRIEWDVWDRDRDAEAKVKDRFRDVDDPLKILIVTAKLLTGFDAPIEGVMYLDKPLRAHTAVPGGVSDQQAVVEPEHGPGEAAWPGRRLRGHGQRTGQGRRRA
jgi:type I restriction enzyme R subunit